MRIYMQPHPAARWDTKAPDPHKFRYKITPETIIYNFFPAGLACAPRGKTSASRRRPRGNASGNMPARFRQPSRARTIALYRFILFVCPLHKPV